MWLWTGDIYPISNVLLAWHPEGKFYRVDPPVVEYCVGEAVGWKLFDTILISPLRRTVGDCTSVALATAPLRDSVRALRGVWMVCSERRTYALTQPKKERRVVLRCHTPSKTRRFGLQPLKSWDGLQRLLHRTYFIPQYTQFIRQLPFLIDHDLQNSNLKRSP